MRESTWNGTYIPSLLPDEAPRESDSCIFSAVVRRKLPAIYRFSRRLHPRSWPSQNRVQDVTENLILSQRLLFRCDADYQSENYICRKRIFREIVREIGSTMDIFEFGELASASFLF